MNYYVVVEGETEKQVYPFWIPLANSQLSEAVNMSDVSEDNFYVITAGGHPFVFEVIDDAIDDVNSDTRFDRLVIAVDSEEMSRNEKFSEIDDFIGNRCRCVYRIVVQHFCLEAWALGNRKAVPQRPKTQVLTEYKALHDVRVQDPEDLPPHNAKDWNRAQFAARYLRAAFNDRNKGLTYRKNNPSALLHQKYYDQLEKRLNDTGHIPSFDGFIQAFT